MVSVERKAKLKLTGAACFTYATVVSTLDVQVNPLSHRTAVAYQAFGFSVFGPTLPVLTTQIGSDQHDTAYIFTARATIYIFASVFFGKLFDLFGRQLGLTCGLFGCAVTLALVPSCKSLAQLIANQIAYGIALAAAEVPLNAWILDIWKEKSNPYMQSMHFFYALGSAAGPFLSQRFLSNSANSHDASSEVSDISIPYYVSAGAAFLACLMQLYLFFAVPRDKMSNSLETELDEVKKMAEPSEPPVTLSPTYFRLVVIFGAVVLCFEGGTELNTFNYLETFIVSSELGISHSKGALMNGAMLAAFTLSRFICIILATRMKTITMLYMNLAIIMAGNIIILFSANTSEAALWTGIVILGYGFGSTWPAMFALIEERITVTNFICSIFISSTMMHGAIGPLINGKFIEESPIVFAYINLISGVTCCLAFFMLHWTDTLRNRNTVEDAKRNRNRASEFKHVQR
ncbi:Major facilitator superfamily domain-containing protein 4B [Halotydeus destructor]|nr:Major facilitator superfamily domain-containing protein 4B [Halotydeus destructor]